jgi:predicted acyl esterase
VNFGRAASVLLLLLAGCFSGPAGGPDAACLPQPHPCDVEWPGGLRGPFEMQPGMPQRIDVASHDGTTLSGWLYLPLLPEGVHAPVLLVTSPYHGLEPEPPGADPGGIGLTLRYVEAGYAVAAFSVRGTGISSGCFENKGLNEQLDQVELVAWAAGQPWSNGRVAMGGTSYPGTTPFMAAIHGAPGLVTILPNGPVTDPYTELHTPQGALYTMGGAYEAGRRSLVTSAPFGSLQPEDGLPPLLQVAPERLCPGLAQVLAGAQVGLLMDDRDGPFWQERQLIRQFGTLTAAVFLSHGLQETAHPFQEDIAWDALPNAPKRMLLGQWDHELPRVEDWQGELIAWMDYWLKGLGTPESVGVGAVRFQDDAGRWHDAVSWPPQPDEALFIAGGALVDEAAPWSGSFLSVPPPPRAQTGAPRDHLCGTGLPGTGLVLSTPPAATAAVLAGNPFLHLLVQSDQPGGLVAAHVYRLRPGIPCSESPLLTFGAADLRFHDGVFVGHDFPVGVPTAVRIDLNNVAAALQAGDTLAVVLSYGDTLGGDEVADPITDARVSRAGQPYAPLLTIHSDAGGLQSFLALPASEAFAGQPVPSVAPRPFAP